ncbi:MAG: hypothetical protein U9O78_03240, partial [Patescibacteria group bacterium]|nr:hypothetical protein [Patescibacteria group bacterium]
FIPFESATHDAEHRGILDSESDFSRTHILKSLVYFEDAEPQPMPKMHKEIKWSEVKKEIIKKVKNFSF